MSIPPHQRRSQRDQGKLEYALIVYPNAAVGILAIVFVVPVILPGRSSALPSW